MDLPGEFKGGGKMIIEDKRMKVRFGMLELGDVFLDSGYFYIKTKPITEWGVCYTAFELVDGIPARFNDDDMVRLVNVRMVVE